MAKKIKKPKEPIVKPLGDPPKCKPGEVWDPILQKCVGNVG